MPFRKNISGMTQCPSNPGFTSVKVQNVDFLKKTFRRQYFFSLLLCSPNMLSSFMSKIGNVYCPLYILEVLTSVSKGLFYTRARPSANFSPKHVGFVGPSFCVRSSCCKPSITKSVPLKSMFRIPLSLSCSANSNCVEIPLVVG